MNLINAYSHLAIYSCIDVRVVADVGYKARPNILSNDTPGPLVYDSGIHVVEVASLAASPCLTASHTYYLKLLTYLY